jgi:hypothetical protein
MESLLSDIMQFADGLLDHWVAFATGSIPVMILGIWERWKNKPVSFRFYVVVFLALGFVAASFQTWRQEHKTRLELIATRPNTRNADVVEHLQKFYSETSEFHRRGVTLLKAPDDDFNKFVDDTNTWATSTGKWVLNNMGRPAFDRINQPSDSNLSYLGVSQERSNFVMSIAALQENMGRLVENSAWDKR